jgi:iron complex transport system substrate-binding protein
MRKSFPVLFLAVLAIAEMALYAQPAAEKAAVSTFVQADGIDGTPGRIVSLAPNVTETIFALGAGDKLVARTDYCNFPAEAADLPSIGTLYNPSIERLVSLSPDLVIASSFVGDSLVDALAKASIPVVCIDKQKPFEGTYALIEEIASLVGRQEEGAELVHGMQETVGTVSEAVAGLPRPKTYFVVDFGSFDGTATGDTFIGEMIDMAGGDNIAKDARQWTFSKEMLVADDPDLVIVSPRWGETAEQTISLFCSTKPYSDLRAVASGSIFAVDSDMVSRQGPRSAEALRLLAKTIHPEVSL